MKRRCGPIRTLNGLGGAGCRPVQASAPTAHERLADPLGDLSRAAQRGPDAAYDLAGHGGALEQRVGQQLGAGSAAAAAIHSCSGGATGIGSGEVSNSTVAMSTPETPSTSA